MGAELLGMKKADQTNKSYTSYDISIHQ